MLMRNTGALGKVRGVCRSEILRGVGKKVVGKGLWIRIELSYTNRGRKLSTMHVFSQHLPNINAGERKGELDVTEDLYPYEGRTRNG
jgi:hypothetical protein